MKKKYIKPKLLLVEIENGDAVLNVWSLMEPPQSPPEEIPVKVNGDEEEEYEEGDEELIPIPGYPY